ncbi:hypothetical protein NCCP691_27620 [Noviherbaspirillum aridicola]|uniref:NEL domain-containing protein n=2 Tax=Noviherbaspirillum aridicola TaxID=2849687 RepID=A0ABQ4Q6A4_9BURK|nr:hypothetical protein NCCP691_27620 [Noviherbaspirillum aridicola]
MDSGHRDAIAAVDRELALAVQAPVQDDHRISQALGDVLDLGCFRPACRMEDIEPLLQPLEARPLDADDATIQAHARDFAESVVARRPSGPAAQSARTEVDRIAGLAQRYLASNRSDAISFYQEAASEPGRRQPQKMALETFAQALPLLRDSERKVALLKRLIDVLPNLEHHAVVARNTQRRGLFILEEAMQGLSPDHRAELIEHLLKNIGGLSTAFSRRYPPVAMKLLGQTAKGMTTTGAPLAVTAGMTGIGMVSVPLIAASAGAFVGVLAAAGVATYLGIGKQAQGTALYLLKRELAGLRKDWARVDEARRASLAREFRNLRENSEQLDGTKHTTLFQFFRDDFIDPANFPAPGGHAVSEAMRRQGQYLRAKFAAAHEGIGAHAGHYWTRLHPSVRPAISPPPNGAERALMQVVDALCREAKRMKVSEAGIPDRFLENLRTHCSPGGRWAGILEACFRHMRGMAEYQNESTRPGVLRELMAMIDRLATGDAEFVQEFVVQAEQAPARCGNNARDTYNAMCDAVVYDKARRGEDGFKDAGALVGHARQAFIRRALAEATARCIDAWRQAGNERITPDIEVDVGLLAESVLGRRFGLGNPVRNMDNRSSVSHVTRHELAGIEARAREIVDDEDMLLDFLAEWKPLRDVIARDPGFGAALAERIASARAAFSDRDGRPVPDGQIVEAADEVVKVEKEATADLLRTRIRNILNLASDSAATDGGAPGPDEALAAPDGAHAVEPAWVRQLQSLRNPEDDARDERRVAAEVMASQYAVPDSPAAVIRPDDLPFPLVENPGGGDCLFLALEAPVAETRAALRRAIEGREDDERTRGMNAQSVAAALAQMPATAHRAAALSGGVHSVPNAVYAEMVGTAGVYAGEDELTLYSGLPENRGKKIVVIDADSKVLLIANGTRQGLEYEVSDRRAALGRFVEEADIALYKTPDHWRRLARPA